VRAPGRPSFAGGPHYTSEAGRTACTHPAVVRSLDMYGQRQYHVDAKHPSGDGRAFAVVASVLAPRSSGPPLHVLPSLDVAYQVVEGRVTFRIGDVELEALVGATVV